MKIIKMARRSELWGGLSEEQSGGICPVPVYGPPAGILYFQAWEK